MPRFIFAFLLMLTTHLCHAQKDFFVVDSICIEGNKKTKNKVILRELNVNPGDTIWVASLEKDLDQCSFNLMNTGLFSSAVVSVDSSSNDTLQFNLLRINLKEMLYLYPVPILELGDRNFNVWWEEYNRRLDRLNYGLKLYHTNFTGQRDYLKIGAQFGYTNKYSASYQFPYLNKKQTLGIKFDINYKRNREIQYNTIGNKQQFLKDDDQFLIKRLGTSLEFTYRPQYKTFHLLRVGYQNNQVAPIVSEELNPDFFGDSKSLQQYLSLNYFLVYENRNIQPYPTEGQRLEFEISKLGLGIFDDLNTFWVTANFFQYFPLRKKWSSEHILRARTALIRSKQPYYNSQALGFGSSFVRGYEFYVIDGIDFFLSRNALRYRVFETTFNWGNWFPINSLQYMPTKLFFSLHADAGYVNNPFYGETNQLNNKVLGSAGLGINLIVFYNKVFKLEYSLNAEGEHGWFLHTQLGI
jgi:outer membrane protein assembly factor BamA